MRNDMYFFIILQLILIWQSSYQKLKGTFFSSIVSFDYDHAKKNTFGVFLEQSNQTKDLL